MRRSDVPSAITRWCADSKLFFTFPTLSLDNTHSILTLAVSGSGFRYGYDALVIATAIVAIAIAVTTD